MIKAYKYNNKELQDELDLNWYDYGARNYDTALGRFMNVDPLAEKYNFQSPYVYADNNPVLFRDINGMGTDNYDGVEFPIGQEIHAWDDWIYDKKEDKYVWDGNVKKPKDIEDKSRFEYVGVSKKNIKKHHKSKHPFLSFFIGAKINNDSFNKYLVSEIIKKLKIFVETGIAFEIDEIHGLMENLDFRNLVDSYISFPMYKDNNLIGYLKLRHFSNTNLNTINHLNYHFNSYKGKPGYTYSYKINFYSKQFNGTVPNINIKTSDKSIYNYFSIKAIINHLTPLDNQGWN